MCDFPVRRLERCVIVCALPWVGMMSVPALASDDPPSAASVVSAVENRGLLTAPGQVILEPGMSYAHASSTVVAIEGLTIVPALVVGLINVSQTQRDISTGTISFRTGINEACEFTLRVPWLHINESVRERRAFDATPVDLVHKSDGEGVGDIEAGLNVQLTNGVGDGAQWIANLRVRAPTGQDPFGISQRTLTDGKGNPIAVVYDEQPTGTGFWSIQPGISMLYPSDPAVLYANLSYQDNLSADKGEAHGGRIDPGNAVELGFGIGVSINDRTSFSLGYDHSVLFRNHFEIDNDQITASFDRLHAGSLLLGLSQSVRRDVGLNVTLAVGTTENAPDAQLTVRMPLVY